MAIDSMRCPPFIDIPGVANFRDIGCCSNVDATYVRRGLVFRSADLSHITAEGTNELQALRIRKIFDLRSMKEITPARNENSQYEAWLASPKGAERICVPIFQDEDFAPEALAVRFKDYSAKGTDGFERAYRTILLNAGPAIAAILTQLCIPTRILINCAAGKDRTGVVVMIFLLLAGCSTEAIAREYHLTEEGLGISWKAEAVGRLLNHPTFRNGDVQDVERMVGAREEVMTAVIEMVEREWGDVEDYLLKVVGITETMVHKCKSVLRGEVNGVC
ncbi:hypothetical protein P7C71_g4985, partial [Lecanoromycetidae sp. Uapishka_2]